MGDEKPNIVYGRLLESAHISGYGFERMTDELEWLLDGERWQQVGPGYSDVNEFLRSIDLSAFNLTDKKQLHKRIKELQPEASVRAIGKATGSSVGGVHESLNGRVRKRTAEAQSTPSDQQESVADVRVRTPFEDKSKTVADRSRKAVDDAAKREQRRTVDRDARSIDAVDGIHHVEGDGWVMHRGDFRDVCQRLLPESVDMVCTDPPYPAEFLPLWSDLAAHAKALLVEDGILVALSGKIFLVDVLECLGEHLTYGWVYVQLLPDANSRILARQVRQSWKPWLAFTKSAWPSGRVDWHPDRLGVTEKAKDRYYWEQPIGPAAELIDTLCPANGVVLDPFAGTGTYGEAALRQGRRFIGIEADAGRFEQCCERLAAVTA